MQIEDNKHIERDGRAVTKIFDNRSLKNGYRTPEPILKHDISVLDAGCGTG